MGYGFGAICKDCGTRFPVNEGAGMTAIPFHCEACGTEKWFDHDAGIPLVTLASEPDALACQCGGRFSADAPARCPECRSANFDKDPAAEEILYD